jgi:pimeloyl-ACP methyl ester carboxylesterase
MDLRPCLLVFVTAACCQAFTAAEDLPPIPPIARVLPPEGIETPAEVRQRLETRLERTKKRLEEVDAAMRPDIEVFTKAVDYALLHREFYVEKDFAKADWALDEANRRLDQLAEDKQPWRRATGLVVQGYQSEIDRSAQPYGLFIPKDHDFSKPATLYVWLHGRGDKSTDLHFLQERATKVGQIAPPGAIVLHPFGRHCVGWKHAGEIDVQEAIAAVASRYKIDPTRTVLIGFSMGGAGAWHIGAHYTDQFVAVSPGAGFAETARYQNLAPDKFPPAYEQKLWGLYDVPDYVRNLFNTEVIAYSGENDKQIQAARIMEQAYAAEGRTLTHLIGPGVEHKYEPQTLEELLRRLAAVAAKGWQIPKTVHVQTRTARYGNCYWLSITGLHEHWDEARADGEELNESKYRVTTRNVTSIAIAHTLEKDATVEIDGQSVTVPYDSNDPGIRLTLVDKRWQPSESRRTKRAAPLAKTYGLQGPIDDAFMSKFVIVLPSGKSAVPAVQRWVEFELPHVRARWRALMRGEAPWVWDYEVNQGDFDNANWILFGDAESNSAWKRLNDQLPVTMESEHWKLGEARFPREKFLPAMIWPNPAHREHYIVLNSGLTFREGHDRTNSLQNPKLPDWAIIDITQPPDAFAPGRIHDAGFFDEKWQLKNQPKGP